MGGREFLDLGEVWETLSRILRGVAGACGVFRKETFARSLGLRPLGLCEEFAPAARAFSRYLMMGFAGEAGFLAVATAQKTKGV